MPTFLFLTLLALATFGQVHAQSDTASFVYPDFTTLGEHSFKTTHEAYIGKILPTDTRPYETQVYVAIGENPERGYLAITARNVWESELIEGSATLILRNGEEMTCSRRRVFNTSGPGGTQTMIALYLLSHSQLRQVIRYGITGLSFPLMDIRTNKLMPCKLEEKPVIFTHQ